jgi:hypothetical protein
LGIASPGYARADRGETTFEFENLNASAVLTDCPIDGPTGLHCTGIVVNAGKNKDDVQKSKYITVDLYDVELIPGSFIPTLIGSGFSDTPKLSISENLKRASVSAIVDISNCTSDPEPICTLVRTVDLKVKWVGIGDKTRTHFTDSFESGGCVFNVNSDTTSRDATVTATVDGVDMPNSVLPQFVPTLSSTDGEQRIECDPS